MRLVSAATDDNYILQPSNQESQTTNILSQPYGLTFPSENLHCEFCVNAGVLIFTAVLEFNPQSNYQFPINDKKRTNNKGQLAGTSN